MKFSGSDTEKSKLGSTNKIYGSLLVRLVRAIQEHKFQFIVDNDIERTNCTVGFLHTHQQICCSSIWVNHDKGGHANCIMLMMTKMRWMTTTKMEICRIRNMMTTTMMKIRRIRNMGMYSICSTSPTVSARCNIYDKTKRGRLMMMMIIIIIIIRNIWQDTIKRRLKMILKYK